MCGVVCVVCVWGVCGVCVVCVWCVCGVCVVCVSQGVNVREKAKQLVTLLKDEERLREERVHALKTKEKMAQTTSGKTQPVHYPACISQDPARPLPSMHQPGWLSKNRKAVKDMTLRLG